MDINAVFTLSYGLYVLGTENQGKLNGCMINTASQVTAEPLRMSITVAKTNLTHDMIMDSNKFSISVLGESCSLDVVKHFGFQSGRTVDKFAEIDYQVDLLGNPYIIEGSVSVMSCEVIRKVDLGTHTLFIADLKDGKLLLNEKPMTYAKYRELKAQESHVPKVEGPIFECSVCHYEYEGTTPFEELPEDYICPVCKQPKSVFIKR